MFLLVHEEFGISTPYQSSPRWDKIYGKMRPLQKSAVRFGRMGERFQILKLGLVRLRFKQRILGSPKRSRAVVSWKLEAVAQISSVCRPFVFGGSMFMSHTLIFEQADGAKIVNRVTGLPMNTDTQQAVSRLDFGTRTVELLHLFDHLHRSGQDEIREKNWGFVQVDTKDVLVFYSILPCTVVFVLPMDQPDATPSILRSTEPSLKRLNAHARHCVDISGKSRVYSHGKSQFDFRESWVHGSGHPIVWDHDGSREYLALVHDRGYCHYGVRIDYESLTVRSFGFELV